MVDPTLDVRIAQAHDAIRTHLAAEESARDMADKADFQVSDELQVSLHYDGMVEIMVGGTSLIMQDEERRKLYEWIVADAKARNEVPRWAATKAVSSENLASGASLVDNGYQGLRGRFPVNSVPGRSLELIRRGLLKLASSAPSGFGDLSAPVSSEASKDTGRDLVKELLRERGPVGTGSPSRGHIDPQVGRVEGSPDESVGAHGEEPDGSPPEPATTLPWLFNPGSCGINGPGGDRVAGAGIGAFAYCADALYAVSCANAMAGRDPSKLDIMERCAEQLVSVMEGSAGIRGGAREALKAALSAFRKEGNDA